MEDQNEKIIKSWSDNATAWINAVRTQALESRRLVTNDAILNTILACPGKRILDVGCGEGWLSNELTKKGWDATGFDVNPRLIECARKDSTAKFHISSYEKFIADPSFVGEDFDAAVCNFSLPGEPVNGILKALRMVTKRSGYLIIQTLHPISASPDTRYEDGWREETFTGFPGNWSPMPWYFRTTGSWINELTSAGWCIHELREPLHPATGKPASLILQAMNNQ